MRLAVAPRIGERPDPLCGKTLCLTTLLRVALADFDRVPLLFGPSPVHRLDRL